LKKLREFHKAHNPDYKGTIQTSKDYDFLNHYEAYVRNTEGFMPSNSWGSTLRHQNYIEINWFFKGSSVEEIMETLWSSNSHFAKECLSNME